MSVAVRPRHAPHSQIMNVNGTEMSGTATPRIDEEQHETAEETQNLEPNDIPRAKFEESYSKEELLAFKESSLTKIRPLSLSDKYCNRDGIWDPELWHYSAESEKRSASPIDSKKKLLLDGIVLSPQGRSFARGCQVTPGGKQGWNAEKQERDGRNKMSGRLGRGWDAREKSGPQRGRVSPSGDTRFERNVKSDGPGRNRRRAGSYESQPEWFTHGPTSQLDTIELRGFEDGDKDNKRKKRRKDNEGGNSNQRRPSADEMFDESKKFDINEFFDMAENVLPISGMFENQITSRFSQWFHNERRSRSGSLNANQNNSQSNSRRSSIADELAEIAGLTLSSPMRTPTPDPDFLFTPIVPATESCRDDALFDLLQDSEIDVQPLLDSVIPHETVKGAVNLEDLEGGEKKSCDEPEEQKRDVEEEMGESTEAFMKLVETMKASGNLPDKPTPTIPDIPPHLLPRPPSSREKSRNVSPSLIRSRSPSPLQLLQEAIRRAQSPVGLASSVHVPVTHPPLMSPLMSPFDAFRSVSPVADVFSAANITRPLTPEELYGAPPVFNVNVARGSDLFEFTGTATNIGAAVNRNQNGPRYTTKTEAGMGEMSSGGVSMHNSGPKSTHPGYQVISQAFVPTSVLRKIHSDKHDHKPTEVKENKKDLKDTPSKSLHSDPVSPQRQPLFDVPQSTSSLKTSTSHSSQSFSSNGRANLMSPSEFSSPKSTRESRSEPRAQPELLTPHRLPLPGSPTSMSPQSLPLPQSPFIQDTPNDSINASPMTTKQRLLTPRSLPLPRSPLVNQPTGTSASNRPSDFGIRPLPKGAGMNDSSRARVRAPSSQDVFKRPLDPSTRHNISGNNMRRFPQGPLPFRGQVPVTPGMMRRPGHPGLVPSPYNVNVAANLGRTMNVHPTALALALRNQQYQMARAAAVAVATAAVNRPPIMSPAQAAAAALMLNQQRASAAALHGLIPQVSPRMFQQPPLRPNLPPALQHRHHVVHRSDSSKENSLSKWFSASVLNQSQSQPAAPGRGAKVLSVEELERHA